MKKQTKKLTLNRETVIHLEARLEQVVGGSAQCTLRCPSGPCTFTLGDSCGDTCSDAC